MEGVLFGVLDFLSPWTLIIQKPLEFTFYFSKQKEGSDNSVFAFHFLMEGEAAADLSTVL